MSNYFYEELFRERPVPRHNHPEQSNRSQRELKVSVDLICKKSLERLGQPLTLEEMEQITGYSRRSLINAFHERFGCSPCKWQQSERLRVAHQLLLKGTSKLRIGTLAWQLGFPSSSKFCCYYRRMFNETPKQTLKRIDQAAA